MQTVQVSIVGGPSVSVPWLQNMNAQQALEGAYNASSSGTLTYALQYFGSSLGYLVVMLNDTFESTVSSTSPYFYWEFLVNGIPQNTGIDNTSLNAGDNVSFAFEMYSSDKHISTTVGAKHRFKTSNFGSFIDGGVNGG